MIFKDVDHQIFYEKGMERCQSKDVYHRALIYCLGINRETREHINRLYDFERNCLKLESINEGWQTSGSLRVTRLAFNLYNDGTPTMYLYENDADMQIRECCRYSVSDIFCDTEHTPYFIQAIELRYPK